MASGLDSYYGYINKQMNKKYGSSYITDNTGETELRNSVLDEMSQADSLLNKTLKANGYFSPHDINKFNSSFFRFSRNDPYNYVDGAREYLFFTKPDLPLLESSSELTDEASRIPYFNKLFYGGGHGYQDSVFKNLCYSGYNAGGGAYKDSCPFIRMLSNRKTSNMDVPDIQVEELETAVNMFGSKILYPKSSMLSDEGHSFTVEFEDTRFLEVYNLFKVWDIYEQCKWLGILGPAAHLGRIKNSSNSSAYSIYSQYCFYKVLNDHIRVFKFLVDNDGETILHMSSAIGCYVSSISRSSFSEIQDRGPLKISVGFKISGWFEDNDPSIANDFNALIAKWANKSYTTFQNIINSKDIAYPLYDNEIGFVSQEEVDAPFIIKIGTSPNDESIRYGSRLYDFPTYRLKWIKNINSI